MPSKLEKLQLQFRQRLMQEKEERLIKIHTDNQMKALSRVAKYNETHEDQISHKVSKPHQAIATPQPHHSPVKKGSPGVDRSRPLPPISKEHRNGFSNRTTTSSAPLENGTRTVAVESKTTRSVGLESKTRPVQKNGATARVANAEVKRQPHTQEHVERKQHNVVVNKKPAEPVGSRTTIRAPKKSNPAPSHPSVPLPKLQTQAKKSEAPAPRMPPGPGQEQCKICGRNFNQDRIAKHVTICSKTSRKKVKVFDATKMRVQGTEAESFVKRGLPKTPPKKPSTWRKQHAEFIETIRQAKMAQQFLAAGGKAKDLPPPPPSDTSHYIQCPYCSRKFNEGAAERHIPKCKNILSNKKK